MRSFLAALLITLLNLQECSAAEGLLHRDLEVYAPNGNYPLLAEGTPQSDSLYPDCINVLRDPERPVAIMFAANLSLFSFFPDRAHYSECILVGRRVDEENSSAYYASRSLPSQDFFAAIDLSHNNNQIRSSLLVLQGLREKEYRLRWIVSLESNDPQVNDTLSFSLEVPLTKEHLILNDIYPN